MNGLKLIEQALKLQEVERVPWVPFVGVHGGKLVDVDATAYLQSAQHMIAGVSRAIELYKPDGIPVVFDLQVEAEILGCKLAWSKENPPAVISHPLIEGTDLNSLALPRETDGRIPLILEATRQLRTQHPGIALYGLITGPFTLALHLLGTEIFMKLFEDPEYIGELMQFCTDFGIKYSEMLLDAGCDVIAVVDPMTSQIDPMSFETFVSPYATQVFDFVRLRNKYSSFFVCGHAQQNIEVMCACKPDNISIDENIPLDFVKDVALSKGISFGGNLKLTSVLLLGNELDSKKEALSCLDLAGKKGFILAPGCDLPMDTPVANLKAVTDLVYDEYIQQATREMEHSSSLEPLSLEDHWQEGKVIIDIITLDSASCAPCQYMVEAVNKAVSAYGDQVVVSEHKIKEVDGIRMAMALGVQNLPTTCINGKVAFISQIPPRTAIVSMVDKALNG